MDENIDCWTWDSCHTWDISETPHICVYCGTQRYILSEGGVTTKKYVYPDLPDQNRRPLKWTHNTLEGWKVHTWSGECGCDVSATRTSSNHWIIETSAGHHISFESYRTAQNFAAEVIDFGCYHKTGWTQPDGTVVEQPCFEALNRVDVEHES